MGGLQCSWVTAQQTKNQKVWMATFSAAALTRVMRAAVPIPADAAASVLHSAAGGGSVVGDVGPLWTFGELNSCELGVFRF